MSGVILSTRDASSRSIMSDGDHSEPSDGNGNNLERPEALSPSQSPPKQSSPDAFAKELSKIQEEQVNIIRKIERERARADYIRHSTLEAKQNLRAIQDKTNNGNIAKVNDVANQRLLSRLEHQLQTAKTKLSIARNENATQKARVQDLRRNKMLQLQIYNDIIKDTSKAKRRAKFCQKEVAVINEKKLKVKMAITTSKQRMVRDMEEFSSELTRAKQSISNTQASILLTIREKLNNSSMHGESKSGLLWDQSRDIFTANQTFTRPTSSSVGHRPNSDSFNRTHQNAGYSRQDIEIALKETEFSNLEELLVALQKSEEQVFALYHETQDRHEEVEKMEVENKQLESKVQQQIKDLKKLEGNQEKIKQELEKSILVLKNNITKYETEYSQSMDILGSVSDLLLNILKNVAIDEEAMDQQILSTGISDRNIEDFLGLIEQRIDDLIQMLKAANHQAIRREDFLKAPTVDKSALFQAPVPPQLTDANDDDEEFYDEATGRAQPINIPVLKDIIQKKMQKMAIEKPIIRPKQLHLTNQFSSMRSRQTSTASLRSNASNKSLQND